jgi:glutamate formiminotransferase / formiminotetrahydrofolate cyclodeaminase
MVANLSAHKRGWDDRWEEFSNYAVMGKEIQNSLLNLVDEDTAAFNRIMEAFSLPKKSEEERKSRDAAIQDATKNAMLVPLKVMETSFQAFALISDMAEKGNPNSVSDAGVGALAVRSCVRGAYLNVRINATGLKDKAFADEIIARGKELESKAIIAEEEILQKINEKIIS